MMKHVQVDIYGRCDSHFKNSRPLPCPKNDLNEACFINLINSYRFYLAFENSLCDDYITEKLWKFYSSSLIFKTNIVPVVKGAKKSQYSPLLNNEKVVVYADDHTSAESLAKYLVYLNENTTAYLDYFQWKFNLYNDLTSNSTQNIIPLGQKPIIQSDIKPIFCYLCSVLHNETFINSETNPKLMLNEWFGVKSNCWDIDKKTSLLYELAQFVVDWIYF